MQKKQNNFGVKMETERTKQKYWMDKQHETVRKTCGEYTLELTKWKTQENITSENAKSWWHTRILVIKNLCPFTKN